MSFEIPSVEANTSEIARAQKQALQGLENNPSLVITLKALGEKTSYSFRREIFQNSSTTFGTASLGLKGEYTGSAQQNIDINTLIKNAISSGTHIWDVKTHRLISVDSSPPSAEEKISAHEETTRALESLRQSMFSQGSFRLASSYLGLDYLWDNGTWQRQNCQGFDCLTFAKRICCDMGLATPAEVNNFTKATDMYQFLEAKDCVKRKDFTLYRGNWQSKTSPILTFIEANGGNAFIEPHGVKRSRVIMEETLTGGVISSQQTNYIRRSGFGHGGVYTQGKFIHAKGWMENEWIQGKDGKYTVRKNRSHGDGVVAETLEERLRGYFNPDSNIHTYTYTASDGSEKRITYYKEPVQALTVSVALIQPEKVNLSKMLQIVQQMETVNNALA